MRRITCSGSSPQCERAFGKRPIGFGLTVVTPRDGARGRVSVFDFSWRFRRIFLNPEIASKPVSRESTENVVREFLERVNAVNERHDLAHRVESVIVFGSYLSEVSRLNDLDLSVELVGNGMNDASHRALREASIDRALASGRRFRNAVDEIFWPRTEVLSLLKNRSRTISFCEWDSLKDMPKLRYRVLFGDRSRIAAFIKDGEDVEPPSGKDG